MSRGTIPSRLLVASLVAAAACAAHVTGAQESSAPAKSFFEEKPAELAGIDIIEHLNSRLPLDLEFTDDTGRSVRLGDYFSRGRPVILTIGYYRCPQLCFLVLNGMVDALKELEFAPGREFEIVTVSVNPKEEHELARLKKDSYMAFYGHPAAELHWHFLTGSARNSRELAEAVGFTYRQTAPDEFAHAAVLTLCTPDGRVSRYLYGAMFDPKTMKLGLLEAGQGKIGTTLERFILWCHVYDPDRNSYTANAMNIMRLGGVATAMVMAAGLAFLWRRDAKLKRAGGGLRAVRASAIALVMVGAALTTSGAMAAGSAPGAAGAGGSPGGAGAAPAAAPAPGGLPEPAPNSVSGFWLPDEASTVASSIDWVFLTITWICIFFFVLILALMVYFMWKYRRRSHVTETGGPTHNTPLELTWSIVPLILVIAIFYIGMKGYVRLRVAPEGAYTVHVVASKWQWQFEHPNGCSETDILRVPANRPVKLIMESRDVLHSLFVPAFRVKQDVVPGRYTTLWFEATKEGEFDLYCTEYCGQGHSAMLARVLVYPEAQFHVELLECANWIKDIPDEELWWRAGPRLYAQCAACHSLDGRPGTGPTWKDLWKSKIEAGQEAFTDGTRLADLMGEGKPFASAEDYILRSMWFPQEKIVSGYSGSMPTFKGLLDDKERYALLQFIKNIDKIDPKTLQPLPGTVTPGGTSGASGGGGGGGS